LDKNKFRPKLENTKDWYKLIEVGREAGPDKLLELYYRNIASDREKLEFSEEEKSYVISSESSRIKTLEDLLEASEVDLEKYEVTRYISNKWDQHSVQMGLVELFQVKAWLHKKYLDKPSTEYLDKWLKSIDSKIKPLKKYKENKKDPVILAIADVHLGGFVEGDRLVPDYNREEIKERFEYIARYVNSLGRPVHVKFLGDMIESFSGKNHKDTWKQIEMHGMEVALEAYDITKTFLGQLDQVQSVDFVGGNHDRVTASRDDDKGGQVVYMIAELLKRTTDIPTRFDEKILTSSHDGVSYIITHGDKRISKMLPSRLILEYGNQEEFNVLLNAHGHEEKIHENSIKFQARQVPPICVPNQYALDNGWSSQSGFTLIMKGDRGGVNVSTISL